MKYKWSMVIGGVLACWPLSLAARNVALSPIFGYDPTIGPIVGGAVFLYPETNYQRRERRFQQWMMAVADGPTGFMHYLSQSEYWRPQWDLELDAGFNNFDREVFDSNEVGAESSRPDQQEVTFTSVFSYHLSESWRGRFGASGDWQQETDSSLTRLGVSVGVQQDTRSDPYAPTQGHLLRVTYRYFPSALTDSAQQESANTLELDGRQYVSLSSRVVSASRLIMARSDSSLADFHLGGDDLLRGYVEQRFTTQDYALLQQEIRFPVWGYVKGVTFAELASIKGERYWRHPYSYGVGLRFGLPPDGNMSVRVDLGRTDEGNSNLFVNFNHIF